MSFVRYPSPTVISPRLEALILSSPRLKHQLLPQGLSVSPYKVLDYHQTLILGDKKGARATFQRRQQVQFQQDGVSAILDHFWGDGVMLTDYENSAGALKDSFRDQGKRHLVIELQRAMTKGEVLDFNITRLAREAFTEDEEWEETTVDHPVERLSRTIIFPKDRPCQSAWLIYQGQEIPLSVIHSEDGTTQLNVRIGKPQANVPYLIRWSW